MNIEFYVQRDGEESAKQTIELHFKSYLEALTSPKSHGSTREYRSRFLDSLISMAEFLGNSTALELIAKVRNDVMDKALRSGMASHPFVTTLNHAVGCAYPSAAETLEVLRPYPLDTAKEQSTQRYATLHVSPSEYLRAVSVLESANIPFE